MSRVYRGTGKMLLCIDDSEAILKYEKALFETSGFIVVTATSAREGLKLVAMSAFDAVLLDYAMPEMNGHQVAREIRRLRPDALVVMFTGSDVPLETYEFVDAVIPKNDALEELLWTVTQLCSRSAYGSSGF